MLPFVRQRAPAAPPTEEPRHVIQAAAEQPRMSRRGGGRGPDRQLAAVGWGAAATWAPGRSYPPFPPTRAADREALAREAVALMLRVPLAVDLSQVGGAALWRPAPACTAVACIRLASCTRRRLLQGIAAAASLWDQHGNCHSLPSARTRPLLFLQVVPQLAYLRAVQALVDLPVRVSTAGAGWPPCRMQHAPCSRFSACLEHASRVRGMEGWQALLPNDGGSECRSLP